jgi:hypothetical protein
MAVRCSGIMPVTQKVITIITNAATTPSEEESIFGGEITIITPIMIDNKDIIALSLPAFTLLLFRWDLMWLMIASPNNLHIHPSNYTI